MNILLVGNYVPDAQESMLRFASVLKEGLIGRGHEVRLVSPAVRFGNGTECHSGVGKWLGYVDKFMLFPGQLRAFSEWADVVHICDHSNAIYVRHLAETPHLVTCHDLLAIRSALGEFPANPTSWTGRRLQQMILSGLRRATLVTCVSGSTRTDLMRIAAVPGSRVSVVPNGLNYPYCPLPRDEAERCARALGLDLSRPLILHVGGNQWYKNRVGVLQIFNQLRRQGVDASLVMAGKPLTAAMRALVASQGLQQHVAELHGVSNMELQALYNLSYVLLFPSLHEGFGWPVIEAQACGCSVITSARPPLADLAGDSALLIDPEDASATAAVIAHNWSSLPDLRKPGLENAARYSIGSMIDGYLRQYAVALNS